VPNFVSFTASIAELAHGEKSAYSITQSPSLFDAREPKRLHFGKAIYCLPEKLKLLFGVKKLYKIKIHEYITNKKQD